jgi:hypothetical protein
VSGAGLGGRIATAVKVDPNTPTTIYVGNDNGKVFKITGANTGSSISSTDISPSGTGAPANGYVSSIEVEVGNSNHMLMTVSNYGLNSVWETTNGGSSWTSIEGNLPDMPIRWITFSPSSNDAAFVATELGVWATNDLNGSSTSWAPTTPEFAKVRTDMIKFRASDKQLLAVTHGRGLFTGSLTSCAANYSGGNALAGAQTATADFETDGAIESAQMISGSGVHVDYDSKVSIDLKPNFDVASPATFHAFIDGCGGAMLGDTTVIEKEEK